MSRVIDSDFSGFYPLLGVLLEEAIAFSGMTLCRDRTQKL
jgi:hypothetical protein